MKTYIPKVDDVQKQKKWHLIDLDGLTLGRAAVEIANILRGKNKPIFTPNMDTGDFVIAVNASKMIVTGTKEEYIKYFRYTGYPGGLKETSFKKLMETDPSRILMHAVKGMIPKNKLGRKVIKKLHVYADENHPHKAQKPEVLKLFES
ncbi:MAG: 50S ribosomal protein L13 [Candidatus Zixiibacteriota bacterium]|nr:MAG: 50S ribosomal protein L13 [candidate division Zixibacteria bacterium]HDL04702.1 50S ribosomal protein L13 [candidate division Zixibacteria bacterium]